MSEGRINQPISGRAGLWSARRVVVKVGSAVLAPRGELAAAAREYARSARELERILQPSDG